MAATKRNISFRISRILADRFHEAAKNYFGKMGICFSAAVLMWLEADPQTQGQYIKRIFDADVNDEIQAAIDAAKAEQLRRIRAKDKDKA